MIYFNEHARDNAVHLFSSTAHQSRVSQILSWTGIAACRRQSKPDIYERTCVADPMLVVYFYVSLLTQMPFEKPQQAPQICDGCGNGGVVRSDVMAPSPVRENDTKRRLSARNPPAIAANVTESVDKLDISSDHAHKPVVCMTSPNTYTQVLNRPNDVAVCRAINCCAKWGHWTSGALEYAFKKKTGWGWGTDTWCLYKTRMNWNFSPAVQYPTLTQQD